MDIIVQVNFVEISVKNLDSACSVYCTWCLNFYISDWIWMWSGFETPVEWEDNHTVFSTDGPDVQYVVSELIL